MTVEQKTAWKLRRFIKRDPAPARLVGEAIDGEEISVTWDPRRSKAIADAIDALGVCASITAYDKEGGVLRRLELEPADEETAGNKHSGELLSVDVPKLVDNITRNMVALVKEATATQAKAHGEGFKAMGEVVNLCLEMLQRVDKRLQIAESNIAPTGDESRNRFALMALTRLLGPGQAPQIGQGKSQPSNGAGPKINFTLTPDFLQNLISQFGGASGDSKGGPSGAG